MVQKVFYVTGIRRGLGKALYEQLDTVDSLDQCDVFINCKHDGFSQVDLLYKAAELGKTIINIGSNSGDSNKKSPHKYQIEKIALDEANNQLFYQGVNTSIVRFGYFDSPRVQHIDKPKLSIDYCIEIIKWILDQPHRIKDITITPRE